MIALLVSRPLCVISRPDCRGFSVSLVPGCSVVMKSGFRMIIRKAWHGGRHREGHTQTNALWAETDLGLRPKPHNPRRRRRREGQISRSTLLPLDCITTPTSVTRRLNECRAGVFGSVRTEPNQSPAHECYAINPSHRLKKLRASSLLIERG